MRGILIDPGAARGLIGSETLRILIDEVVRPKGFGKFVKWKSSGHTFTGISPKAERSLGMCGLPIGLLGLELSMFWADVIGGDASLCPGLVPLKSLIALGCCILFAYFANGDGVLGIWDEAKSTWTAQRLYLTESGHYLLRIDNYYGKTDDSLTGAIQGTTGPLSKIANQSLHQPKRPTKEPMDLFSGVVQCTTEDYHNGDPNQVFQLVPSRT